jgi:hypothetical protein
MARLWAMTVEFDKIEAGDQLPVLVKWETEHTIRRFDGPDGPGGDELPEFLPDAVIDAYVAELLEKAFPYERVHAEGSGFDVTRLKPVRLGDTTGISGHVAGKRESDGRSLVDCEIVVEVDGGGVAATARAVVVF